MQRRVLDGSWKLWWLITDWLIGPAARACASFRVIARDGGRGTFHLSRDVPGLRERACSRLAGHHDPGGTCPGRGWLPGRTGRDVTREAVHVPVTLGGQVAHRGRLPGNIL